MTNDDTQVKLARLDERVKGLETAQRDDRATVGTLTTRLWGVVATVLGLVAAAIFRSMGQ